MSVLLYKNNQINMRKAAKSDVLFPDFLWTYELGAKQQAWKEREKLKVPLKYER